jgi:septum site-determining protein MinD
VEEKRKEYDFVFLDCPAGMGQTLEILSNPRDRVLLVTTPDRTSVSDGERVAEFLFRRGCERCRLIVNRVRPTLIKKNHAPDIDDIIDEFKLIRLDDYLADCIEKREEHLRKS